MKNNKDAEYSVYLLLKDCLEYTHIRDKEFICRNISMLYDYKHELSSDVYSKIEAFVDDVIKPILFDFNYFDFLIKDEFGSYNNEGHFIINSNCSLEMMMFMLNAHSYELIKKLDEFAKTQLKIQFK